MGVLRLKTIMDQKKIGRDELADMVGVSKTTITNIRTEENLPTISLLIKIAEALDVDVRELFEPTKNEIVTHGEMVQAREHIIEALKLLKGTQ